MSQGATFLLRPSLSTTKPIDRSNSEQGNVLGSRNRAVTRQKGRQTFTKLTFGWGKTNPKHVKKQDTSEVLPARKTVKQGDVLERHGRATLSWVF